MVCSRRSLESIKKVIEDFLRADEVEKFMALLEKGISEIAFANRVVDWGDFKKKYMLRIGLLALLICGVAVCAVAYLGYFKLS